MWDSDVNSQDRFSVVGCAFSVLLFFLQSLLFAAPVLRVAKQPTASFCSWFVGSLACLLQFAVVVDVAQHFLPLSQHVEVELGEDWRKRGKCGG